MEFLFNPIHPGEILMQSNCELRLERRALREKVAAITPLAVA